jgi:hypothetical protein
MVNSAWQAAQIFDPQGGVDVLKELVGRPEMWFFLSK